MEDKEEENKFPIQLPNPNNLYMPDLIIENEDLNRKQLPIIIKTFPKLFSRKFSNYTNSFHQIEGVQLLTMTDMLKLQLLYAARQILSYLCIETNNSTLEETLPFEMHGILGLYQELSLFIKMTSNIMLYTLLLSGSSSSIQSESFSSKRIWIKFKEFMLIYAPWCKFKDITEWKTEAIRLQAILEELSLMYLDYKNAKLRFESNQ